MRKLNKSCSSKALSTMPSLRCKRPVLCRKRLVAVPRGRARRKQQACCSAPDVSGHRKLRGQGRRRRRRRRSPVASRRMRLRAGVFVLLQVESGFKTNQSERGGGTGPKWPKSVVNAESVENSNRFTKKQTEQQRSFFTVSIETRGLTGLHSAPFITGYRYNTHCATSCVL